MRKEIVILSWCAFYFILFFDCYLGYQYFVKPVPESGWVFIINAVFNLPILILLIYLIYQINNSYEIKSPKSETFNF
jgi:hypothetical protein